MNTELTYEMIAIQLTGGNNLLLQEALTKELENAHRNGMREYDELEDTTVF